MLLKIMQNRQFSGRSEKHAAPVRKSISTQERTQQHYAKAMENAAKMFPTVQEQYQAVDASAAMLRKGVQETWNEKMAIGAQVMSHFGYKAEPSQAPQGYVKKSGLLMKAKPDPKPYYSKPKPFFEGASKMMTAANKQSESDKPTYSVSDDDVKVKNPVKRALRTVDKKKKDWAGNVVGASTVVSRKSMSLFDAVMDKKLGRFSPIDHRTPNQAFKSQYGRQALRKSILQQEKPREIDNSQTKWHTDWHLK